MRRKVILVGFALLALSGCSIRSGDDRTIIAPPNQGEFGDGLPTRSNKVLYAEGWSEIKMLANFADTEVDSAGHFHTGRNACGKEEYGALSVEDWNALAAAANAAASAEPLRDSEARCIDAPTGQNKYMDGTADLILTSGKRALFENRGGQICSFIKDSAASAKLIEALHKVVRLADQENCHDGWGSN